jgi:hypothetical protein
MFAVHYRFKSARTDEYSAITFDGPFIALRELKSRIIETHKLGNSDDFDLHVVNAQTEEGVLMALRVASPFFFFFFLFSPSLSLSLSPSLFLTSPRFSTLSLLEQAR